MNKILSMLFVIVTAWDLSAAALEPGDKAVPLPKRGWVRGEEVSIPSAAERNDADKKFHPDEYIVLLFWGTWANGSTGAMNTLNALEKKYPGLRIVAITRDTNAQIDKFLETNPRFNFSILQDDSKDRMFKAYLGNDVVLPRTFVINSDKEVLWNGDPNDLPDLMEQLANNDFSLSKEKKLTPYRQKLSTALQTGDSDGMLRNANNLLEIDSRCGTALRAALFVYETRNQPGEALRFIDKLLSTNDDWFRLYMLKLELQLRAGASTRELHQTLKDAAKKFHKNSENLNLLSWFILDRLPFRLLPPDLLLEISGNAMRQLPANAETALRASCYEAYGRTLLLLGHPAEGRTWIRQALNTLPEKSESRPLMMENDKIFSAILKLNENRAAIMKPQK